MREKQGTETDKAGKAGSEEQKQSQKLLSEIWSLGTPAMAGRSGSPSRVRKAGERTPDENLEKHVKKAKKAKKNSKKKDT